MIQVYISLSSSISGIIGLFWSFIVGDTLCSMFGENSEQMIWFERNNMFSYLHFYSSSMYTNSAQKELFGGVGNSILVVESRFEWVQRSTIFLSWINNNFFSYFRTPFFLGYWSDQLHASKVHGYTNTWSPKRSLSNDNRWF